MSSNMQIDTLEWLKERRDNTRRIAAIKTGAERDGWLEDVNFFSSVIEKLEEYVRIKQAQATRPAKLCILKLVDDFADASFNCGKYQTDANSNGREANYEPIYAKQRIARMALLAAIDELWQEAAPIQPVETSEVSQ